MQEILRLFLTFAKMGCVTFGGGYAMLPVLERELIEKRMWVTFEEVMRYYTIAQVTPGIIAVNICTFIGYKRKGIAGGIIATIAFVMPSATLAVIISFLLQDFSEIPTVKYAFNGIRLAAAALVFDTVLKLIKQLPSKTSSWRLTIASFILCALSCTVSLILNINPVFVVIIAGLTGFLFVGKLQEQNNVR
ncbi:MAG: chromate transporter [Spirochaetaceae bacterium]|jgi:chromate transporter|nr:chromate transporter [Spirochaetaceae bacterium]